MCVGYVQNSRSFHRAGMRNEWSSGILAVLDITIEEDDQICAIRGQWLMEDSLYRNHHNFRITLIFRLL